jgi:hypothetical protein
MFTGTCLTIATPPCSIRGLLVVTDILIIIITGGEDSLVTIKAVVAEAAIVRKGKRIQLRASY